MLIERLDRYDVPVWLVNTGWTGGPYGTGERMNIAHTRAMVRAALDGRLDGVPTRVDPIFGVEVPLELPGRAGGVPGPARDVGGPGRPTTAAARARGDVRGELRARTPTASATRSATPGRSRRPLRSRRRPAARRGRRGRRLDGAPGSVTARPGGQRVDCARR